VRAPAGHLRGRFAGVCGQRLPHGGAGPLAQRSAWFVALVPPAFVLAFAYSEAIAGCLAVAAFLALRSRRWWWAALAGFVSGLLRPSGALLAVPAAIEGLRGLRGCGPREWVARAVAVLAPLAGVGAFLGWVGLRFGRPLFPIEVQQRHFLRGGSPNPLVAAGRAGADAPNGRFWVTGFHFPLLVVIVALAVVAARRWPASYSAFAAATILVAYSAHRLGSVERYSFAAFPLVLALASLTENRRAEQAATALAGAGMLALATLAFLGLYIP